MKRRRGLNRRWSQYGVAILMAVVVGTLLSTYSATRPPVYEARMSFVASPPANGVADSNYLNAANAGIPGVAELLRSPTFLQPVAQSVPGGPTAQELASGIRVELVPASAVFRVALQAHDPDIAAREVEALAVQLEKVNLFGGLAKLQPIQERAEPARKVAPDATYGVGLALLVGIVTLVVTAQLLALAFPALKTPRQVQRAANTRLPVFVLSAPGAPVLLRDFLAKHGHPVVIPVGAGSDKIARQLEAIAPVHAFPSEESIPLDGPKLFIFDRSSGRLGELKDALAMAGDNHAAIVAA